MATKIIPDEMIVEPPDISHIEIEDDEPVDNIISAKQQRLLVESLYSSWRPDIAFIADANVGVFASPHRTAIVPDVFISTDVTLPADMQQKQNRTYFIWEYGKPPDVVVEIVSNRKGNERGSKLVDYARLKVSYYIIFDPYNILLDDTSLEIYELNGGTYHLKKDQFLDTIGLGVTLWQGVFEAYEYTWMRWVKKDGSLLLTGAEATIVETERANVETERAAKAEARSAELAAKLRALGIEPDE